MDIKCSIPALDLKSEIMPNTIRFFHDGLVVRSEPDDNILIKNKTEGDFLFTATLTIENTTRNDSGTYECEHDSDRSRRPEVEVLALTIVDCEWSQWQRWSGCSKTCGGGSRSRSRKVEIQAENGGQTCEGDSFQIEDCSTNGCPGNRAVVS